MLPCQQYQFTLFSTVGELGTLSISEDVLKKVEYLHSLTNFESHPDRCYSLIPAFEWGTSLAPIKEIISFVQNEDAYCPFRDVKVFSEAYNLGHYFAMTRYMDFLSQAIDVEASTLCTLLEEGSPRKLRKFIQKKLRSCAHFEKVSIGMCAICNQWLTRSFLTITSTPCCMRKVHEKCWLDTDKCAFCDEPLRPLPCCSCKEEIESFGHQFESYRLQKELRTKCCDADIHRNCLHLETQMFPYGVCPGCNCVLQDDGSISYGQCSPGDVFNAQRQMHYNHQRRYLGLSYTTYPPRPIWPAVRYFFSCLITLTNLTFCLISLHVIRLMHHNIPICYLLVIEVTTKKFIKYLLYFLLCELHLEITNSFTMTFKTISSFGEAGDSNRHFRSPARWHATMILAHFASLVAFNLATFDVIFHFFASLLYAELNWKVCQFGAKVIT